MQTQDLRVVETNPIPTPRELKGEAPLGEDSAAFVAGARAEVQAVLRGEDPRKLAIVGPCSIHDPEAALDYARRLKVIRDRHRDQLVVLMRVYFEKPRTTIGWKGLINDPHLDGTCDVTTGLRTARGLLLRLAAMGIPAATETLDPISPQYLAELITWTAIGARTTESQTHREMASGLSMPVGFKNGTDGGLNVALNGMKAAREPHSFLGIDLDGRVSAVRTTGNSDCHVVLRGGSGGPNFDAENVARATTRLKEAGLDPRVLVDCSHANSNKDHNRQAEVLRDVARQIRAGSPQLVGVMLESHLVAGNQKLVPGQALTYGQSITDACIDIDTTEVLLGELADAVREARAAAQPGVADCRPSPTAAVERAALADRR